MLVTLNTRYYLTFFTGVATLLLEAKRMVGVVLLVVSIKEFVAWTKLPGFSYVSIIGMIKVCSSNTVSIEVSLVDVIHLFELHDYLPQPLLSCMHGVQSGDWDFGSYFIWSSDMLSCSSSNLAIALSDFFCLGWGLMSELNYSTGNIVVMPSLDFHWNDSAI